MWTAQYSLSLNYMCQLCVNWQYWRGHYRNNHFCTQFSVPKIALRLWDDILNCVFWSNLGFRGVCSPNINKDQLVKYLICMEKYKITASSFQTGLYSVRSEYNWWKSRKSTGHLTTMSPEIVLMFATCLINIHISAIHNAELMFWKFPQSGVSCWIWIYGLLCTSVLRNYNTPIGPNCQFSLGF